MKELDKISEEELNEMERSYLSDEEFKEIVINMLHNSGKERMERTSMKK